MPQDKNDFEELKIKPVYKLFPEALIAMNKGICPTCGVEITGFRDILSRKEYEITGVCQACQDRISLLPRD